MNTKHLKNFGLLLLPSLISAGVLTNFIGISGIRLFFLSLLGLYPTFKFINAIHTQSSKTQIRLFGLFSILWWLIFLVHTAVLSISWLFFDSSIDSFFIIQAIANTTTHELLEFITHHLVNILFAIIFLIALLAVYYYTLIKWFDINAFNQFKTLKSYKVLLGVFIVLVVAAYAIKPSRNNSPFFYWANYHKKIQKFQQEIKEHRTWQNNWILHAKNNFSHLKHTDNQTHVLVISESITSENLGVCGYPRETTPYIAKNLDELTVFCQAYSAYPTTIDSIKSMLTDMPADYYTHKSDIKNNLLAYAHTAGFKTFWLSNQDDAYLSSLFGSFANVSIYNNRLSGRSSFSKDEELLPYFKEALNDTADKKLIILHLIGAHPNYSARYPQKFNHFPDGKTDTAIDNHFKTHDFSLLTQKQRNHYDNAILYQDWVFYQIFSTLKNTPAKHTSLTFISDHGNEVGHTKDYAGHNPSTETGYKVPIVIWQNQPHTARGVNKDSTMDATLLDNHMLSMMGIATQSPQPSSWLDEEYQFVPPSNFPYWQ